MVTQAQLRQQGLRGRLERQQREIARREAIREELRDERELLSESKSRLEQEKQNIKQSLESKRAKLRELTQESRQPVKRGLLRAEISQLEKVNKELNRRIGILKDVRPRQLMSREAKDFISQITKIKPLKQSVKRAGGLATFADFGGVDRRNEVLRKIGIEPKEVSGITKPSKKQDAGIVKRTDEFGRVSYYAPIESFQKGEQPKGVESTRDLPKTTTSAPSISSLKEFGFEKVEPKEFERKFQAGSVITQEKDKVIVKEPFGGIRGATEKEKERLRKAQEKSFAKKLTVEKAQTLGERYQRAAEKEGYIRGTLVFLGGEARQKFFDVQTKRGDFSRITDIGRGLQESPQALRVFPSTGMALFALESVESLGTKKGRERLGEQVNILQSKGFSPLTSKAITYGEPILGLTFGLLGAKQVGSNILKTRRIKSLKQAEPELSLGISKIDDTTTELNLISRRTGKGARSDTAQRMQIESVGEGQVQVRKGQALQILEEDSLLFSASKVTKRGFTFAGEAEQMDKALIFPKAKKGEIRLGKPFAEGDVPIVSDIKLLEQVRPPKAGRIERFFFSEEPRVPEPVGKQIRTRGGGVFRTRDIEGKAKITDSGFVEFSPEGQFTLGVGGALKKVRKEKDIIADFAGEKVTLKGREKSVLLKPEEISIVKNIKKQDKISITGERYNILHGENLPTSSTKVDLDTGGTLKISQIPEQDIGKGLVTGLQTEQKILQTQLPKPSPKPVLVSSEKQQKQIQKQENIISLDKKVTPKTREFKLLKDDTQEKMQITRLGQKTKQKERTKQKVGKLFEQVGKFYFEQKKEPMVRVKEATAQLEELSKRQRQLQKQKQSSILRQVSEKLNIQTKKPVKPTPFIPPIETEGKSKLTEEAKKVDDAFKVLVRKKGEDVKIGEFEELSKARKALFGEIRSTLRASGFITKEGKPVKLKSVFGEFRRGKKEPFRVVQKKTARFGTKPEVKEAQFFRKQKGGKKVKFI